MAEFPCFPIYTDAYLADTRHLNATQHGAYFLLLLTAWRTSGCRLPDDDVFLARCASMDLRSWRANKDVILAFWKKDEDGFLYQDRQVDERKHAEHRKQLASQAGRASALKRNKRHSTSVGTDVQPKSNPPLTPNPYPLKKERTPTPSGQGFVVPDGIPVELWEDFEAHRKQIRKPMTDSARRMNAKKLLELKSKGDDIRKVMEKTIASGWSSFFALRDDEKPKPRVPIDPWVGKRASKDPWVG